VLLVARRIKIRGVKKNFNKKLIKTNTNHDVRIKRVHRGRVGSAVDFNTARGVFAPPETVGIPAALVARAVANEILLGRGKTIGDGGDETP
jgi:hypothetical protein